MQVLINIFIQTLIPAELWEKGLPIAFLAVAVVWIAMQYLNSQKEKKDVTEKLFVLQGETVKCITCCTSTMDKMADNYSIQNEMLESKIDYKFQQNKEELLKGINELGFKLTDKMNGLNQPAK